MSPANRISGKLLIIGVVMFALAAAGASWWFRYAATHRAARFWGPEAARLIRDAPYIELRLPRRLTARRLDSHTDQSAPVPVAADEGTAAPVSDISHAPGLSHLRNALLEDGSFVWPPPQEAPSEAYAGVALAFRDDRNARPLVVTFSTDFCWLLARHMDGDRSWQTISCAPIAAGLREFFDELTHAPPHAR